MARTGDPSHPDPMGWAWDESERLAIERRLARLVGRRIERVRYVEIGAVEGPSEPMWRASNFDSVDYGLELDLHDGTTWAFVWKMFDINMALLIYPGRLVPTEISSEANIAIWDVGDHWRVQGPDDIATVTTVWTRHAVGPGYLLATGEQVSEAREGAACLMTIILASRNRREAILTLGERQVDGTYRDQPDNVAVFFSSAEARAAGVLMPGDADAIPAPESSR
jgi:hypothetical protein